MKIANPDIQFEADGRKLTLRFSFRAMAALQDHWNLNSIEEAMAKTAELETGGLVMGDYTAILWAGLRTHNSEITFDEAEDILDFIGIQNLVTLISSAASGGMMEGGGKAPVNPPRKPRALRGR